MAGQTRKHNAPIYPDPRDQDQYKINVQLIKIIKELWIGKVRLENRVTGLENVIENADLGRKGRAYFQLR